MHGGWPPATGGAVTEGSSPEEIIGQIRQLEQAGLKHLMLLPSFETQYGVIEDFARNVMEKM